MTALLVQIPLVAVVAYGFLSRKVRSEGEIQDVKLAERAERERVLVAADRESVRLLAQHERELRDKEAAALAWKQLYERVDAERREDRRELAESVHTLELALDLVKERRS